MSSRIGAAPPRAVVGRATPLAPERAWSRFIPLAVLLLLVPFYRFLAEPLRRSLLIETPRAVPVARAESPDAQAVADRFFAQRDTVHLVIPHDMSVGEFLDMHHLSNTRGIRGALRQQTGASRDDEILKEGTELKIFLTVPSRT